MYTHTDLAKLQAQSLKMQGFIRKQTYSPEMEKTLRRFSSWEVAELILKINPSTFRGRLAADPSLPEGLVEEDGRQRWYTLDEINELRRKLKIKSKSLMPVRPAYKRAVRAAIANFKGEQASPPSRCISPMPPRWTVTGCWPSTLTRRRR